ncbi:hypothetical protein FRB90_007214 [Tulasnella sp. 427]|nr:hypothetical protein FRB90_007214 [Tulasnella sp. 427]
MEDDRPLSDYPITQGSVVAIVRSLGFAKPVIYLYPPTPIKATVKISLADSWKFSALYPSTSDGRLKGGRLAEWEVLAQSDGTMRVSGTSTEIAYLFWEAESLASVVPLETPPPSRPTSPLFTKEPQIRQPLSTTRVIRCSPEDSVLLAAKEVPSYVDKALLALGLHVEGRTSFVTYWLPALLKHRHVALRFVPQVDYEAAAPLEISPPPGITTRIFMVFHGITSDRLGNWKSARERSSEPAEIWKSIVGIDEARQQDLSLFRVLEWGGMEIE